MTDGEKQVSANMDQAIEKKQGEGAAEIQQDILDKALDMIQGGGKFDLGLIKKEIGSRSTNKLNQATRTACDTGKVCSLDCVDRSIRKL